MFFLLFFPFIFASSMRCREGEKEVRKRKEDVFNGYSLTLWSMGSRQGRGAGSSRCEHFFSVRSVENCEIGRQVVLGGNQSRTRRQCARLGGDGDDYLYSYTTPTLYREGYSHVTGQLLTSFSRMRVLGITTYATESLLGQRVRYMN